MTHFDAAARPMTSAFQSQPNPAPYTAEKPRISLEESNPAATAAARPGRAHELRGGRRERRRRTERHSLARDPQRCAASAHAQHFRTISTSRDQCRKSICASYGTCISRSIKTLHLGRVQASLDAHARPQRLLRHGAHPGRLSQGEADLQPGAFHDGAGGRVRVRAGARSVSRTRPQAGRNTSPGTSASICCSTRSIPIRRT